MTAVAIPDQCAVCDGSGWVVIWFHRYWCTAKRCPFCGMHERARLAWLKRSHA